MREWLRIRDETIRPLLRALVVQPDAAPASASPGATAAERVNAKVVARIEAHRDVIDRGAAATGVPANVIRGIIAAESAGNERTGEGGSGYKGLMQSGREPEHLDPAVSVREGAKKYKEFTQSMRRFFRETLKQDFDALAADTRIRIVMAAYNAGPLTVKRAVRFARNAGDAMRWLEPQHYLRALVSTGAYNPVPAVLEWGVRQGLLAPADMAADLARLSGEPAEQVHRTYAPSGTWNVKRLAAALRPHLMKEKSGLKNDGSLTFAQAEGRGATKSLLCAVRFKQVHTDPYLSTVLRYKRFFETR